MSTGHKTTLCCGDDVWYAARHPRIWPDTKDDWFNAVDLNTYVYNEHKILAPDHAIVDDCFDKHDQPSLYPETTRFILKTRRGEAKAAFRFLRPSTKNIQIADVCPEEYQQLEFMFGKQITEISGFCHPRNAAPDTIIQMLEAVYEFSFDYGTSCWAGIFDRSLPRRLGKLGIVFNLGNREIRYRGKSRVFCWGEREQIRKALATIDADLHNKLTQRNSVHN